MRYKVPQNIDMPDRILGPLTMLQFVYAVVGGGAAYVSFMALPYPLSFVVAILIGLLTLAIVFLKVNERPFTHFLLLLMQFITVPKQRTWHKGDSCNMEVEVYKTPQKNMTSNIPHKDIDPKTFEDVARRVDSPGADVANVKNLIKASISKLARERSCECASAAQFAIQTNPKYLNKKTLKKLDLIVGKYIQKK